MSHRISRAKFSRAKVSRAVATLLLVSVLGACSEERDTATDDDSAPVAACSPEELLSCARESSIAALVGDEPVEATGEPITIGMVNQENTPAGSYPELSQAAQAFVTWFNEQLGGVDGRPIRLEVCNTGFSAEGSTACGQRFAQAGVPVVLGGIDVFGNATDVLLENEIPFVGGIPVSEQSMRNDNSFQWSGGTWGATVAFADHAAAEGAKRVAIVYGDFGSVADGAAYGKTTLEDRGVEVTMVPFPIVATDLSAPMQAAASGQPDAIIVLAADTGCGAAFDSVRTLGITSAMYYTGACAAPPITDAAGDAAEGAIFNVEGPVQPDDPNPDTELYNSVLGAYVPELDPVGAATVAARSVVNLYSVLRGIGADELSPTAIADALRASSGASSFMGHDYTCDGEQLSGLPATCAPQQILVRMESGELAQLGDWIDVGAVYPG
ncbi:MAG TPA: ABC transporter substrate-binding protein [Microthrixaceae bacterium]|nr:ABC transporter substrate-binding protein [Microthrixaceae bacterium]